MESKRTDYLDWDTYFMEIAKLTSRRSKDPCTQVGAVIVNQQHRIVGTGYNGFPNNIDDSLLPWGKDSDDPLKNKYLYVCHGEMNAIMNCNSSTNGSTMYVTLHPCVECMKLIIQAGIDKVIFLEYPKRLDRPEYKASQILARFANVRMLNYRDLKIEKK